MSGFFEPCFNVNGRLCLSDFVTPDHLLHIPSMYWVKINSVFSQKEVIDAISEVYDLYPLHNPLLVHPGLGAAVSAFKGLQKYSTKKAIITSGEDVFTRKKYRYGFDRRHYIQGPSTHNDASDYFHRPYRMKAGHVNFLPPLEVWNDRRRRKLVLKSLFSLKQTSLGTNAIETSLSLRSYVASQFKPSVAKAVYDLFRSRDVYDPSSGWGDRFAGFSASEYTRSYVGVDPNEDLHDGYWMQGKTYHTGKAYEFLCTGAEDVDLSGYDFDLVFTSPPYFDTEKYSDHPGQSWKRYGVLESWQEDFLYVLLRKSWGHLRKGGVLAINISDLGVKNDTAEICDPMNDFISTLPGAKYVGGVGMRLSARPQTGIKNEEDDTKNVVFVEPVWVWSKGSTKTIEEYLAPFVEQTSFNF